MTKLWLINIGVCLLLTLPATALADGGFVRLVGLPFEQRGNQDINVYIQALYRLAIGIAASLAVLRLILAGAQYMLSDVVTTKENAKKNVQTSIVGLLVVLAAVLILNTINPQLTNLEALDIRPVNVVIDTPDPSEPATYIAGTETVLNEGDRVYWIGFGLGTISTREACEAEYGVVIEGNSEDVRDRCLVSVSNRQAQLPTIADANCPEGRECRAELCDEVNGGLFRNCRAQCLDERNGIYYDQTVNGCVFYNDSYDPIQEELTVDDSITYHRRLTGEAAADAEAAGDPPIGSEIEIIGEVIDGGFVTVRYPDGSEESLACNFIIPSVCNNQ